MAGLSSVCFWSLLVGQGLLLVEEEAKSVGQPGCLPHLGPFPSRGQVVLHHHMLIGRSHACQTGLTGTVCIAMT